MVDPSEDLPAGLRPPLAGDQISLTYGANVGPFARVGDLARQLDDLETAVSLGEKWGITIARAASVQELLNQAVRYGPEALRGPAGFGKTLGYRESDLRALEDWIEMGWRHWRPGRFPYRDPEDLLQSLADYQISARLGTPVRVDRMSYENPLDVTLTGSGFLVGGVIYLLRMIRDWSSARRTAAATADQAEADADRARARAGQAWTEADILRWFAREAQAGRWHVPPGDLLTMVRSDDIAALNRLSEQKVTLELPQGLDPDL